MAMSDLSEYLRSMSEEKGDTFDQAAAEIERLGAELDNERARGVHSCGPNCQRPLCVANRRIAELTKPAQYYVDRCPMCNVDVECHDDLCFAFRLALAGERDD
jgi:hypothetical protein